MNVVAIIQARMTSTRLPGKVLLKVRGKSLLEYELERIRRSKLIHQTVIATTTNSTDDPIVELAFSLGIPYYRGSEEDVLSRYYEAAKAYQAEVVVRLTSDCPLIDPVIIDQTLQTYLDHANQFDYISNTLTRSFPRGMDTEVFSFQSLEIAYFEATQAYEREHVTPYLYLHPDRFRLGKVVHNGDLSKHRWTVDTPEDFELIRRIIQKLYPENPNFTMQDILHLLDDNPEWIEINRHIEQKKLGE